MLSSNFLRCRIVRFEHFLIELPLSQFTCGVDFVSSLI